MNRLSFSDHVSPTLPKAGPIILTIPGLSDVQIAGATASPEILYRFPGPYILSGIWLGEQDTATPAVIANLRLRMQDDNRNELFVDGFGGLDTSGGLALCGRSPRWQPFRRVIRAGAKWLLQIDNENAGDVIPQLYFRLESE